MMKLVTIESPFAGDRARNAEYLRRAIADCLKRGEAPFASHGLYPGALDDNVPEQRKLGMEAGFAWTRRASDAVVVYRDYGMSHGMLDGVQFANRYQIPVIYREIGENPNAS